MRGIWIVMLAAMFSASWVWAADGDGAGTAAGEGGDPFISRPAGEPTDDARRACEVTLQSLRSQVELYKLLHGDKYPTADGKPDGAQWQWELLTQLTPGSNGKQVGPFLLAPASNPVSRSSTFVSKPEKGAGWLLDEKGRIFALDQNGNVLAETPAPRPARLSSVRSFLQTLRSAIELYKLQHGDRYPTTSGKPIAAEWSWELVTGTSTDMAGRKVGPYLQSVPQNALTGSSRVVAKPEKDAGWVLTPDGRLNAVREDGGILDENRP